MQYGIVIPDLDGRTVAQMAYEAEQSGWDGVFVWDTIWGSTPWVTLAAAAMRTERIKLGTMLTPVTRRRPWQLAADVATLDQLSGGRAILPVGLGAPETGFDKVREEVDRKRRAEMLDEGLAILDGLWSGRPFSLEGRHYTVREVEGLQPQQSPRVPIWVVGAWPRPKSMRRALHWDGLLTCKMTDDGQIVNVTPEDLREIRAAIAAERDAATPFEIIYEGETSGSDPSRDAEEVRPFAEAGVTWWLEGVWDKPRERGGVEGMRERVLQGPPRLDR